MESIDALVGMLSRALIQNRGTIGTRIRAFGQAIARDPVYLARASQLIFLCGASHESGRPSARREALRRFLHSQSPDLRVVYAEGVLSELAKIGHNKNVLDLEHEISNIADRIIIVVESVGAVCELGAFAHESLRRKLVVINDEHYRTAKSFLNEGPIAALSEAKAPVFWYPMASTGINKVDGIGATFSPLAKELLGKTSAGSSRQIITPTQLKTNKVSLYFVHDLVLMAGPISLGELVELLKFLFGDRSYDPLKQLLGVLRAADFLVSNYISDTWIYTSTNPKPFLRYKCDVASLMASFRAFHLRTNPQRFIHG